MIYSLAGDSFSPSARPVACAAISAAGGAGLFVGQAVVALLGHTSWRTPFFCVAALNLLAAGLVACTVEDPARGACEDAAEARGAQPTLAVSTAGLKRLARSVLVSRTNGLVLLQALPGGIPWGVAVASLHGMLLGDLRLSVHRTLTAEAVLGASAFAGAVLGGLAGESACRADRASLPVLGGVLNVARVLPAALLFSWPHLFGPIGDQALALCAFYPLLAASGILATMSSPVLGTMLLNVNLPETRGLVAAGCAFLDDLAKGIGVVLTTVVAHKHHTSLLGTSLVLWALCGFLLVLARESCAQDELLMQHDLDEAARECLVLRSKRSALSNVSRLSREAGRIHFQETYAVKTPSSRLRWSGMV